MQLDELRQQPSNVVGGGWAVRAAGQQDFLPGGFGLEWGRTVGVASAHARGCCEAWKSCSSVASTPRSRARSTTASSCPCSSRNSAVWVPAGGGSPVNCSITRGPAKPIKRAWLRQQKVALAGEAGVDAARRGVGEHGDRRHARLVEAHGGGCRLAHLHQAQHAFLHARATAGDDGDERYAPIGRELQREGHLLADDAAHAAAHEREVEDRQDAVASVDARGAGHDRLVQAGLAARQLESIAIRDAIGKDQRIDRDEARVTCLERLGIGEQVDPLAGGQLEVIAAGAANAIALPGGALRLRRAARAARLVGVRHARGCG